MVRAHPKVILVPDCGICPLRGEGVYQQSVKCGGMEVKQCFESCFAKLQLYVTSNRERNGLGRGSPYSQLKVCINCNKILYAH